MHCPGAKLTKLHSAQAPWKSQTPLPPPDIVQEEFSSLASSPQTPLEQAATLHGSDGVEQTAQVAPAVPQLASD